MRVERYLAGDSGGERPQCDYLEVLKTLGKGKDKGQTWKEYIMRKFELNKPTRRTSRKRVKLDSLNDNDGI